MKTNNMWNEYVAFCNAQEAKRKEARKIMREAHPTFYKIMDVVSTIMVIVGVILMIYSAVQYAAEKISQAKMVANKMVAEINAISHKLKAENEAAKACPDEVEPEEEVVG